MKYLLIIFLCLFTFSVFSNQEKNREVYKKALESCSSLKGNNFANDSVLDILYGENLNLNCLIKTLSEYSYTGPDFISDKDIKSKLDNNSVKVIEITAARKKCYRGESEYYCINNIIIEGKRFIYIISVYTSSFPSLMIPGTTIYRKFSVTIKYLYYLFFR